MRKKLVLFCFALLALGGLLIAPAPVAACCPTSCPVPGYPNISGYCSAQCGGNCNYCFYGCYSSMISACQSMCTSCSVCCGAH